jgi:uncharacterized protein
MDTPRIAIVGSGIAGLSAAYFLAPHARITVFESAARLGGHANTAHLEIHGESIAVDTGFMVFNPQRYPLLVALFRDLGVPSVSTPMSFSVSLPGAIEYSSNARGLFGDLRHTIAPSYYRFLYEIIRFNKTAKRFLHKASLPRDILLGDFLERHQFSRELVAWYLYPMMSSIWSTPSLVLAEYSAYETFRFLDNHMLLNVFTKPAWRTVRGGSEVYVTKLTTRLEEEGVVFHTKTPIISAQRSKEGVRLRHQREELFDRVVFATHADTTLALLADATEEDRAALSPFRYSKNTTVLHGDVSFMPQRRSAWASWNYHSDPNAPRVSLTYHMNALQHIPEKTPVFVTLNPGRDPIPERMYGTYEYTHPIFDAKARNAQDMVAALQGTRNTYFAGAYLGFGFHEDGIESAAAVAKKMNLPLRLPYEA